MQNEYKVLFRDIVKFYNNGPLLTGLFPKTHGKMKIYLKWFNDFENQYSKSLDTIDFSNLYSGHIPLKNMFVKSPFVLEESLPYIENFISEYPLLQTHVLKKKNLFPGFNVQKQLEANIRMSEFWGSLLFLILSTYRVLLTSAVYPVINGSMTPKNLIFDSLGIDAIMIKKLYYAGKLALEFTKLGDNVVKDQITNMAKTDESGFKNVVDFTTIIDRKILLMEGIS